MALGTAVQRGVEQFLGGPACLLHIDPSRGQPRQRCARPLGLGQPVAHPSRDQVAIGVTESSVVDEEPHELDGPASNPIPLPGRGPSQHRGDRVAARSRRPYPELASQQRPHHGLLGDQLERADERFELELALRVKRLIT
jgi:hypothetical protein